jgi:uncharacterized protein
MIGIGTLVNAIAIILGGSIGTLLKQNLRNQYKDIMLSAVGLATLVLGFSGTLAGVFKVQDGSLSEQYILEIILFLVVGGILGVLLKISNRLDQFGNTMQEKIKFGNGNFSKGFVTGTLIFCIGAMAIMGSMRDGMYHDYTVLYSKSILDFITAMVLASTLGVGVLFSAIPVAIYQLTITIIASIFGNFLPEETKLLMNIMGSILIIGISLNILEIKKVNVADMLPAVFIPIFYVLFKQIIV